MNRINRKLGVLALAAALALGFSATAQAYHGGWGGGGPGYSQPLNQEQRNAAEKIYKENYDKTQATRDALVAKRAELDAQLANPAPDKGKIERLSREIGELRGKLLTSREEMRAQLKAAGIPEYGFGPGDGYGPDGPRGYYHGPYYDGPNSGYDRGYGGHGPRGHRRGCWW